MKKVFLMAALVLASAMGSYSEANASSLMPVKKTTAKKTTTKKKTTTSTKKATTSTKKTTASSKTTTSTAATTTPSSSTTTNNTTTASSTTNTSSTGSTVAGILGGLLGAATGNSSSSSSTTGGLINGILNNVIGSGTFKQEDLCAHTWKYSKPGCAFTSENLLAKAGGEIAASKIEDKLATYYNKFGFKSSNTYFTFSTDGTFNAKIDGKSWNGTYTFNEKTHAITMKGLILSMSGYATKTTNGISLLFEQKKLLNLLKTLSAFSGSSALSAVGSVASNYDGVRIGFEMTK